MFSRVFLSVSYGMPSKTNLTAQKITSHRALNLDCKNIKSDHVSHKWQVQQSRTSTFSLTFIRHISGSTTKTSAVNDITTTSIDLTKDIVQVKDVVSTIPEGSKVVNSEVIDVLVGEPSFQSLGIGSWYPPGILQQWFEILHVSAGLPWWGSIMLTTVCIRVLMFPLVLHLQRYTVRMQNLMPEVQFYQNNITEARKKGDKFAAMEASRKLETFMALNGMSSLKNVGLPLVQTPIFISVFWGLRGMVSVPVESMRYGGLWWFQDLTASDPTYLLPLLTSATLALTIEMSTSNMKLEHLRPIRNAFRVIPILTFPLVMKFEAAILCYWVTSNTFTLVQSSILRIPSVKKFFGIQQLKQHVKENLASTNKGFLQEFKDALENMRVSRELHLRQIHDQKVALKARKKSGYAKFRIEKPSPRHDPILAKRRN